MMLKHWLETLSSMKGIGNQVSPKQSEEGKLTFGFYSYAERGTLKGFVELISSSLAPFAISS